MINNKNNDDDDDDDNNNNNSNNYSKLANRVDLMVRKFGEN